MGTPLGNHCYKVMENLGRCAVTGTTCSGTRFEAMWTATEQDALDDALRATVDLTGKARWRRIGELVDGRDAKEYLARYKEIRAALLAESKPELPELPESKPEAKPGLEVIVASKKAVPTLDELRDLPRHQREQQESLGALTARIRAKQQVTTVAPPVVVVQKPPTEDDFPELRVQKASKPRSLYERHDDTTLDDDDDDDDDVTFFWGEKRSQKQPPSKSQRPTQSTSNSGGGFWAATTSASSQGGSQTTTSQKKKKKKPSGPKLKNLAMSFK